MAFDVFLTYARQDQDMAALVARRLRALKFKVRFNRKDEASIFDEKDTRDALRSTYMLVLWSEAALTSDWVRAAASIGHSRENCLIEAGLDETIPYEPFRMHKRHDLQGFTSRTNVEGWYDVVTELGRRAGRPGLREWIDIPSKDEDAKTVWLTRHPDDALAVYDRAQREKKLGVTVPKAVPAAPGATAALAASAIKNPKPKPVPHSEPTSPAATADVQGLGRFIVPIILACIGALFALSYFNRSAPLAQPTCLCEVPDREPVGISDGTGILEPGPIINDTEPDED